VDAIQSIKAAAGHLTPEIVLLLGGSLVMSASVFGRSGERHDVHSQRSSFAAASLICLMLAMLCIDFDVVVDGAQRAVG